jgi:hypothetical protein
VATLMTMVTPMTIASRFFERSTWGDTGTLPELRLLSSILASGLLHALTAESGTVSPSTAAQQLRPLVRVKKCLEGEGFLGGQFRPSDGQCGVLGERPLQLIRLSRVLLRNVERLVPRKRSDYLDGDDAGAKDPVFASRKGGGRLTERAVLGIVKRAAAKVGIEAPECPHWLRHVHASHAIDRGATLPEVQTTLGHGNIATTSGYPHARPERECFFDEGEGNERD